MNAPVGQENFGDSEYGMRYAGYEDPKSFEPYQLLLLGLDFIFNWVMDWAHTDPLAILVVFVFQCLGLIVSFIVYIMASASQAMQSGLRKTIVYHHQVNLMTWVIYIILTCYFYVWALRKSWPTVSDQFSFSFSSGSSVTTELNDIMTTVNTSTTTLSPLMTTLVTHSVNKSRSLRGVGLLHHEGGMENLVKRGDKDKTLREFYTLWSSGFVALYVIQRTVAIIYYCVCLKATYLVLNASTIDKLNVSKYPNPDGDNSRSRTRNNINRTNPQGNSSSAGRIEVDEGESDTSEIADERDWRNFRNSFEISNKKPRRNSQSYLSQGVVTLSPKITGRRDDYFHNNQPGRSRQSNARGTSYSGN